MFINGGTVVLGAEAGDEGKGRIVDVLAQNKQTIVRYSGGCNAGHTIIDDAGNKSVFRLLPSAALHRDKSFVLGQGMVIDLAVLASEISALPTDISKNLYISQNAHIVMPYHIMVDAARDRDLQIGTTKKGIGPAYEDKVRRTGIRIGDLFCTGLGDKILTAVRQWDSFLQKPYLKYANNITEQILVLASKIESCNICDTSKFLEGETSILFEGAQGTILDIDHGTYPFVTSSSTTIGGVLTGAGVSHKKINEVVGVFKAYTTRVGNGPFPSEILDDLLAKNIREIGNEYGSVTKRPRRVGWLDVGAVKRSCTINGIDTLAITKIDVLSYLDQIKLYLDDGSYKTFDGWQEHLAADWDLWPSKAKSFISFIEDYLGVKLGFISVGPRRNQLIRFA